MDDEVIQEFLAESWENLARLDTEIVDLEKSPGNVDLLSSIFRTIHTIKGTCGFIGLEALGKVAHSAENVLGQMRNSALTVTPAAVSLILAAVDRIKELLRGLESTGKEPVIDSTELIAQLDILATTGVVAMSQPGSSGSATVAPQTPVSGAATMAPQPGAQPGVSGDRIEPVEKAHPEGAEPSAVRGASAPEPAPDTAIESRGADAGSPDSRQAIAAEDGKKGVADLSIRVNVDVLDSLMNLVGELVLTRNQLLQMVRADEESRYAAPITHLNRVTTDLQEGVMKTRMQPIGNAWSKLPRLVRDLSQITGKQIELEMTGAETELDRTVLDAIKDPLTHMVRNSADHGIESPDQRRLVGKSEVGRLRLHAYHEGGHVVICIEDDGAGINLDKVRRKAIQSGLISEADSKRLSESEILQFIFLPGVSTAEKISSVSGRGVGMDVVKTQIEKIGGTVDVSSRPGLGTSVKIKIPLTLAIISALVVESGGESFAIPQLGVVELVRLPAEDRHKIERIHNNEVFRLRRRLLPLVHLDQVLELDRPDNAEAQDVNIVVVQVGDEQIGLIVSEVFDTEEIVVKPMGSLLKDVNIYQGTTILGDGRVIMILDVAGIASQFGTGTTKTAEGEHSSDAAGDADGEMTSLLLFDRGDGATMSVPLSLVARLEEVPRDRIERTGERLVVQYRDNLLPLLSIDGVSSGAEPPDPQPVIVFSENQSAMGLLVNRIQDILEERLIIRMQSTRPGVMGTAIIDGKATDVIDTQHYLMRANPDWFARNDIEIRRSILIIDDSQFFLQLARTNLETAGYRVTTAQSARRAVEMLERGRKFDLVISELDLPQMTGCEFAEWVRARPESAHLPLIALTGISGTLQQSLAAAAGFDRFHVKFNPQQVLTSIEDLCLASKLKTGATA
jgi:two-component system, chemotaxis family, sensor kinase CheA